MTATTATQPITFEAAVAEALQQAKNTGDV
jgi:hypothetical protein